MPDAMLQRFGLSHWYGRYVCMWSHPSDPTGLPILTKVFIAKTMGQAAGRAKRYSGRHGLLGFNICVQSPLGFSTVYKRVLGAATPAIIPPRKRKFDTCSLFDCDNIDCDHCIYRHFVAEVPLRLKDPEGDQVLAVEVHCD